MTKNETKPTTDEQPRQQETSHSGWVTAGIFSSMLAVIAVVAAFSYGYYQLSQINLSLARMVTSLQHEMAVSKNMLAHLQQTVGGLQLTAQHSQELTAKQEQIINEWQAAQKGDLSKWYIAEAQYLVKLANDQLQLNNVSVALTILQRADQVLQHVQEPATLDIHKALASDIMTLQSASSVDVTGIYLRLTELNHQLDQLPLPVTPLQEDAKQINQPAEQSGLSWWKNGLNQGWDALRKIVIVRRNTSNMLPVVAPEEKLFLYQNLHAQMEAAMWGLLHRNGAVYQASLARAIAWVHQYFAQEAPVTQQVQQQLQDLIKLNVQPPALTLTNTLQLFDNYFAQPNAAPAPSVQQPPQSSSKQST